MELKEYQIATNGISLHVTELGRGPAVSSATAFRTPRMHGGDR